jgi:hypothetical protein
MAFPGDVPPELPVPDDTAERAQPKTRPDPVARLAGPDLGGLPIAGITRRRVAWMLGAIVSIWIVAVFARQVGDVAAASDRAARLRLDNAGLASQVGDLQRELDLVQRQTFIEQEARAYGLGARGERPFILGPDAGPLAEDAPGSAAVRLGARSARTAPLDIWLDLLFGPSR